MNKEEIQFKLKDLKSQKKKLMAELTEIMTEIGFLQLQLDKSK